MKILYYHSTSIYDVIVAVTPPDHTLLGRRSLVIEGLTNSSEGPVVGLIEVGARSTLAKPLSRLLCAQKFSRVAQAFLLYQLVFSAGLNLPAHFIHTTQRERVIT
jgi:hypothetical protein